MAAAKRRKVVNLNGQAYRKGREDGYPLGWNHGRWLGHCESIIARATPVPVKRPIHVLYVTSGKGYPYSPLDNGIYETLKTVAERVTLAFPVQDVAKIAAKSRPDVMLVLDGMNMPSDKVQAVGSLGIRTAIWFTDDPYYSDVTGEIALRYHSVFTLERSCLPFYSGLGCPRVHYLPLGVFPGDFRPRNPSNSIRGDVSFVGTAYWNRVNLFHQLIPLLAHRRLHISGMWWDRLPEYDRWRSLIDLGRWMDPAQTSERYNASKIVINAHRAHIDETFNQNQARIPAVSPNPRTFEISACATLQMTDRREDISQFYIPGQEIITYDSPQDLVLKTEYYLEHEEERQAIALRGLYRTLKEHTYISRLNQLLDLTMNG